MDRLTAFVAIAHLKLRLETLQRYPEILDSLMAVTPIKLPAPMHLAGLKSRLARAKGLEVRAGVAGVRVDSALDIIETGVAALEGHAPQLEQYGNDLMSTINSLLEPSNGGPPLDGEEEPAADPTPAPPPGPNGGPRIL